jgi:hypothetical protein
MAVEWHSNAFHPDAIDVQIQSRLECIVLGFCSQSERSCGTENKEGLRLYHYTAFSFNRLFQRASAGYFKKSVAAFNRASMMSLQRCALVIFLSSKLSINPGYVAPA